MAWGVRNIRWALAVGFVALGLSATAFGQGAAPKAPAATGAAPAKSGTLVALVDIGHVFKNHPRVKQQVEAMKADLGDYEKEVVASRQDLSKQREKMLKFAVGSPEYKQVEEQIAHNVSDLQVRDQLKKKEVLEREAKIYYDAYNEVLDHVSRLSNEYGISLVIRFDSQPIEPTDRNSVQAGVNRNVVFQRNLDLTPMVLERLGASAATAEAPRARPSTGAAGTTATRPAATGAPRKQ